MISFDDVRFQWEEQNGKRRLVIFVYNVPEIEINSKKLAIEHEIKEHIKLIIND